MKINLKKAISERLFIKEEVDLGLKEVKGSVLVEAEITESNNVYIINGSVKVIYNLECSRCLTIYEDEREIPLYLVFKPLSKREKYKRENEDHVEIKLDDEDINIIEIDHPFIEFDEYLKNEILLNLPIKNLCKKDCKGLCPKCGTNLNKNTCDCEVDEHDERLSKLKELKNKMFNEE